MPDRTHPWRKRLAAGLAASALAIWLAGILLQVAFPWEGIRSEVVAVVRAEKGAMFTVYPASPGDGYQGDRTYPVEYRGGWEWREVRVGFVVPATGALRFDVSHGPNRVELASLRIRTPATEGFVEIPLGDLLPSEGFHPLAPTPSGLGAEEGLRPPAPLVWTDLPADLFPADRAGRIGMVWHAYRSANLRFLAIALLGAAAGFLIALPSLQPSRGWRADPPPGSRPREWMNGANLALARWAAVLLVVVYHAYGRVGLFDQAPFRAYTQNGPMFLGNTAFLALSGFLIAQSLRRNRSSVRFLLRRYFRLLPLLWLFVYGLLLILGPAVIEGGWRDYFSSEGFRRLLATGWVAADSRVSIPGLLKGSVINPVLHIFPAFLMGYALLWAFWKIRLLHPFRFLAVAVAFGVLAWASKRYPVLDLPATSLLQLNAVLCGAAVGLFYPAIRNVATGLLLTAAMAALAVWYDRALPGMFPAALGVSFLFATLGRLRWQLPLVPLAGTYCFFLIHWPVQSLLLINFKMTDPVWFFLATVGVVFGLSALAERFVLQPVEKRGDRLIERLTGAPSAPPPGPRP